MNANLWKLSPHVCRLCLGRIMVRDNADGSETARCSCCGAMGEGGPESICACGMKLKSGKSAGLKCAPNPSKSPDLPHEYVAVAL